MTYGSPIEVRTRPVPEITLNDVIAFNPSSDVTQVGNTGLCQVGFQTDITGANAVLCGVPGITSNPVSQPGNNLTDKALVVSIGPGRKYVIGYIDQTSPAVLCAPGETAIYGSTSSAKCSLTGFEVDASKGDMLIKSAAHPSGLAWDSPDDPSIIDAYNDLAAKYNKLLTLMSAFTTLNGGPVYSPPEFPTDLSTLITNPDFQLKYSKL